MTHCVTNTTNWFRSLNLNGPNFFDKTLGNVDLFNGRVGTTHTVSGEWDISIWWMSIVNVYYSLWVSFWQSVRLTHTDRTEFTNEYIEYTNLFEYFRDARKQITIAQVTDASFENSTFLLCFYLIAFSCFCGHNYLAYFKWKYFRFGDKSVNFLFVLRSWLRARRKRNDT